jgi:hypothetical protein
VSQRIAIVGAYGSGKTLLSTALSELTGLPRTHGSAMKEPVAATGTGVHDWTPAQLLQMTVNRYTERVLGESQHPDGFVSDGSVVHEWVYAKVRLVAGSYPVDATPLARRHRPHDVAVLEEAVDQIGLLMKQHAERTYDFLLHVPIEFELARDNRPINENFRRVSDGVLLPALAADGLPVHTIGGSLIERLEKAQALLDCDVVTTVADAARRAENS